GRPVSNGKLVVKRQRRRELYPQIGGATGKERKTGGAHLRPPVQMFLPPVLNTSQVLLETRPRRLRLQGQGWRLVQILVQKVGAAVTLRWLVHLRVEIHTEHWEGII